MLKKLIRAQALCEKLGKKLTAQRTQVLKILYESDEPKTAYQILDCFRKDFPNAQAMTVYRILDFLQKAHLIHKIINRNAFAPCAMPENAHQGQMLLCETCGRTEEIESQALNTMIRSVLQEFHFKQSDKPLEFVGVCEKCG